MVEAASGGTAQEKRPTATSRAAAAASIAAAALLAFAAPAMAGTKARKRCKRRSRR